MHGKFPAQSQQIIYRTDIDGLRAIAVLGVLLFHAGVPAMHGGFVGVDVFFVISGYLITGIIIDGCRNGDFSFFEFYGRRARRILPALTLVLACSLAAGWFILLPPDYEALSRQAVASALFVPNILFWSEAGYFDHAAISKPLLHLWSLGIEEQFYLFWPLILVAVASKRKLSVGLLILIMSCSFAICVHLTATSSESAFFLLPSRVWELSLGALIAHAGQMGIRRSIRSTSAILGLVAIAAATVLLQSDKHFPGYVAALPALGTAAVIWAGRDTIVARTLSWRPIVYIGLISYPLYLWHWPLFSFGNYVGVHGAMASLALLAVSFLLAALTYEVIEKRLRKWKIRIAAPRVSIALIGIAAVAIIVTISGGRNYHYQTTEQSDVASILATMKYNYGPPGRLNTCWLDGTGPQNLAPECSLPNDRDDAILVWGDSHAALFYSGVRKAFPSLPIWQTTTSSCPVTGGPQICNNTNAEAFRLIRERKPKTVIIFAAWEVYSTDWTASGPHGSALRAALARIQATKVPNLIVLGPSPFWDPVLPRVAYTAWERTGKIPARAVVPPKSTEKVDREIKTIVESAGASFISIRDFLCNANGCLLHVPGKPGALISWDYGHFTAEGAEYIASNVLRP